MVVASKLAFYATLTSAAALQIPFLSQDNQAPIHHVGDKKPLIDSAELQDLISGDRLMARAKEMYKIAKLGEPEYNHPTRVIGGAGKLCASGGAACSKNMLLIASRPHRNAQLHL